MGASKTADYTQKEIILAKYAKAISHPARVAILNLLLKKQACVCCSIVEELPISQSTVSQHLKELKEAGLIKGEIEGTAICYCIDEKAWAKASAMLTELFGKAVVNRDKCC